MRLRHIALMILLGMSIISCIDLYLGLNVYRMEMRKPFSIVATLEDVKLLTNNVSRVSIVVGLFNNGSRIVHIVSGLCQIYVMGELIGSIELEPMDIMKGEMQHIDLELVVSEERLLEALNVTYPLVRIELIVKVPLGLVKRTIRIG
ncbi:MAG: hypothetical protein DRN15_05760 [Thermoprotei archaeon]|nr:MAG: hypothetical protein DRN15_05760 [Thermoprotei archaeon]RLF24800.1 MAG: hypothetical protein DRM97_03010 [Thermoprotei archaeon]